MRLRLKNNRVKLGSVRYIFYYFSPHIKPHRNTLIQAFLCMLGMALMELLRPWPIKIIFDVMLMPQPEMVEQLHLISPMLSDNETLLMVITFAILLIALLLGLFGFGQAYLTSSVGQKVVAAIRHQLYSHIQRLSHSFHDETSLGDLIARLNGDIRLMRELMVTAVIYISERSITLVGMIAIMAWLNWKLTLVALTVLPLLTFTVVRIGGGIKKASRKQRRKESQITSTMTDRLSAITLVQAYAREAFEEARFFRQNTKSTRAGLVSTRLEANLNRLVQIILAMGTAAVLWFGVKEVQLGTMTPGDLLVFTAYLSSLYKPVRKLASLSGRLAKATVSGERIVAILETKPEIQDAPDALPAPDFKGIIDFDQVSFAYQNGQSVFTKANLHINQGETIALVAQSGAGKSTAAKLLLRFYDPVSGRVKIDGIDVRHYQLESVRNQIAIILQQSYLFNASVFDNITYGKLDSTEEEVIAAAKAARAHDFIEALPEGYETIISEGGSNLSGGQQQRISIARAIIRNAPILILDEPTSSLDQENKIQVEQALNDLSRDKTCILITHDKQAALSADRILTLKDGVFVETDWVEAEKIIKAEEQPLFVTKNINSEQTISSARKGTQAI